ncbi:acyltransferase family protein [Chitinimonas sp. PSY-7]|uniref:acyltransferase family protein n=1 Tax=Chitinimonas sp. PSY-7 TaxID=3459088 RepID=UPI00403FCF0C
MAGFQGGFSGVDVFFVISGYLMTAIVFSKLTAGRFSLRAFYLARAIRIVPALALLCLAVLLLGWFLLLSVDYKILGKHVASAMGFFSNTVFFKESGYFDVSSHEKWLLHTWSLSVEWQFYLLYPLILLLFKRCFGAIRWVLLSLALVSLALCIWASYFYSPGSAFYLLPMRSWEMLVGGLVYLFPLVLTSSTQRYLEWSGVALICLSVGLLNGENVWPGWLATVPVVGTALVIWSARSQSVLMGNLLAQRLGMISYSVYLWHWPIVVLLSYMGKQDEIAWVVSGLLLTVFLGECSYRLIEVPSQKLFQARVKRPGLCLITLIVSVAAVGRVVYNADGVPGPIRSVNSDEK